MLPREPFLVSRAQSWNPQDVKLYAVERLESEETLITRLTRKIRGQKPISPGQTNGIRKDGTGNGVPRAKTSARAGTLGLFTHQANIELQIVDMLIEIPRDLLFGHQLSIPCTSIQTYRNVSCRIPLLKALILLEPDKLAELVERTYAPFATCLDTHDLDAFHDRRGTSCTVRTSNGFRRLVQDTRKVRVSKATFRCTLQATKTVSSLLRKGVETTDPPNPRSRTGTA